MSAVTRLKKALASSDEYIRLALMRVPVKPHARRRNGKTELVVGHKRNLDISNKVFQPASDARRKPPKSAPRNPIVNPGSEGAPPKRVASTDASYRKRVAPAQKAKDRTSAKYARSDPFGGPNTLPPVGQNQKRPKGAPDPRARKPMGTKEDPIITNDVTEAAVQLARGNHVRLKTERQVSTLVKKLAEIVEDAKSKGEKAPNYDLCKVTVENTNLFCVETKGIPRVKMPQLGGIPVPGSEADKFPKNKAGEVDLSEQFAKYLTENDVTGDGKPEVVDDQEVDASVLKASQNELGGAQVAAIAKSMEEKGIDPQRAWLWVSNDDYVIDGHHRWAAMVAYGISRGDPVKVPIHRVDLDIITVLDIANDWTERMGIQKAKLNQPIAKLAALAAKLDDCGCS